MADADKDSSFLAELNLPGGCASITIGTGTAE
jgi:hypothetical protein